MFKMLRLTRGSMRTSGRSYLPLYFAIVMILYTSSAGITTVYAMLSGFYRDFDEPLRIGWVVTSYYLVASICAALCGRLGDVVGRRRMAIAVLFIAGLGSIVSARASGLNGVIGGCALQGTTGCLTALALGIVREALPREKMAFAVGIVSAAGVTGGGLSFMVAGYLIDHFSWRGGFYMKVGLVVLTVAALLAYVPVPQRKLASLKNVNLLAGLAFAPGLAGVFVSFQLANEWSWHDANVWAVLVGSLLVLVVWGWHQIRQVDPLIDVRSLCRRPILLANVSISLLAMGCMQNGQVMSLLLQQPLWTHVGFGLSAGAAGALLLPLMGITLIGSPWGGSLAGRLGARSVALIGCLLIVAGWSAIALYHQSLSLVVAADVVALFGLSFVQPAVYLSVVEATPAERTSEATGMTFVFVNAFLSIGGQAVFLLLATSTVKSATAAGTYPSPAAYLLVFTYLIATATTGFLVAWLLPKPAAAAAVIKVA